MKWHDNPAINAAIDALDKVLMQETKAGRCRVPSWRFFMMEDRQMVQMGAGCDCPTCAKEFAASATKAVQVAVLARSAPQPGDKLN